MTAKSKATVVDSGHCLAIAESAFDVWAGKLLFLAIPACYLSHRLVDAGWQRRTDVAE
jgi:hypothetical protein